jgi:hypothetical protein
MFRALQSAARSARDAADALQGLEALQREVAEHADVSILPHYAGPLRTANVAVEQSLRAARNEARNVVSKAIASARDLPGGLVDAPVAIAVLVANHAEGMFDRNRLSRAIVELRALAVAYLDLARVIAPATQEGRVAP